MAISIVFCYAREDEKLVEQLKAHLRPLEREQLIAMWYDRNLIGGVEWQRAINEKLDNADLILLLISSDFMNSDHCYNMEMPRALELRKQGKAHVIPIILRHGLWQAGPLRELSALPTDGVPVTDTRHWKSVDEALLDVAQGICLVLQQLAAQPATAKLLNPDLLQKVLAQHGLLKKEKPTQEKYRLALHRDPRIAKIQIMSMSRPLDISSIYVRLRIHEEVSRGFKLDPLLQMAGMKRDPNILLEKKSELLKTRASQALEPDEAIRKYTRCVIVGDPGSGKTTLLKYLALKSVDGELANLPVLPIHIELNAFVSSKNAHLLEFAAATWGERYGFATDETLFFMQRELAAGRAMLLLDALDETVIGESSQAAEASYKRVADIITATATRFHQAPIVVTARKAGYQLREPLAGFNELEILDFSLDDMKRFITNWFHGTHTQGSPGNATDLIAKLERALRIQELATNPLLLSLIVLVYESQLDLPERRAELYKRCIEILLSEWDSKRNVTRRREFQQLHKRLLLEEIAWHFHQRSSRYFSEHELLAVIARFLPAVGLQPEDSKRILQEIANENGILKEQAQGWYGFIHMTLQEYCAAQYLTDHNELETLMQFVDDPRWEEVVLLYAGQAPDASPLLERLIGKAANAPTDDIFRNNLIMAGRCLAARPTIRRVELREEVLSSLLTLLKRTYYSLTREQVIETLLGLGDSKVNKRLLDVTREIHWWRENFTSTLVRLGKETLEPGFIAMIKDEQCPADLRYELAKYISWQAFERDFTGLVAMIKDEQCPVAVRRELIQKISPSPWFAERNEFFDRALPDLLSLLRDRQRNASVRLAIVDACFGINDSTMKAPVLAELRDLRRIEPSDGALYRNAFFALQALGEAVPASDIVLFLSHEQEANTIQQMCNLLITLKDSSVIPDLIGVLRDEQISLDTRQQVVTVIYSLGQSTIAPELFNVLQDERLNIHVRVEIGSILVTKGVLTISAFLARYPDKRFNIYLCVNTLKKLTGSWYDPKKQEEDEKIAAEIVPELLSLLQDRQFDTSLRTEIARALGQVSWCWPTGTALALLNIMKSEPADTVVYDALVLMLAEKGEAGVSLDVLQLLKKRRYPQNYYFNALTNLLKDQQFVPDLLSLLTDSQQDYNLRSSIANVLEGLIEDDETTAQLANYVSRLYIDNAIYSSLWRLSRRTGVKIPAQNNPWGW